MGVENPKRPKNPYNEDDEQWGNRDAYRTFIKPVEQPKVPKQDTWVIKRDMPRMPRTGKK